jgi:peptide/nickel transport system substrate-binding protein
MVGGVAGCGGDGGSSPTETETDSPTFDDDDDFSPTPTSRGEIKEERLDNPFGTVPRNIEVGWGGSGNGVLNYLTTALGTMRVDGEYEMVAMKDYTWEDKELTIEIEEDYTYHNGDPLDIQDAITGHQIVYWLNPEDARWAEPPERVDQHTARFVYANERPETLVIRYFSQGATGALPRRFLQKSETYLNTVQEMKDASTSEEKDEVLQNVVKGVPEEHQIEHIVETQRGSGPYMIESMDDVTDEYVHMVRYDDSPDVTEDTPPELRLNFAGGSSARDQMITNNVTDWGNGAFPERLRGAAPDNLDTVKVGAKPQGTVVHFNYINKDVGNRNVRRAIYSALEMSNVMRTTDGEVLPHTYQLGMTENLCDNFLGEDFVSNRIQYPHAADTEAAASYMERDGYSKQNGTWVDSDGEETDITLVAHTNMATVANAIASPLQDFGLNVETTVIGNPNYNETVRNEKDYDMALWSPYGDWGGVPHPYYFYRIDKHINLALAGGASGAGTWRAATSIDDLQEETDYIMQDGQPISRSNHHPIYPVVPQEMGAEEVSGEGMEINLLEIDNHLDRGDEVQKRSRLGARYYNFDLPNFMTWEETYGVWGDVGNFNFPAEDSPTMMTNKPHQHLIYGATLEVQRE